MPNDHIGLYGHDPLNTDNVYIASGTVFWTLALICPPVLTAGAILVWLEKLRAHDRPEGLLETGDSGQGMTGGIIAGIVISEAILGRSHPWTALYNPARLPPPTGSTLQSTVTEVKNNIEVRN